MNKKLFLLILALIVLLIALALHFCPRPTALAICTGGVCASDGSDIGNNTCTGSVQWIHGNCAVDGDTITLPAGTFNWARDVSISKGITIKGQTHVSNPGILPCSAVPTPRHCESEADGTLIIDARQTDAPPATWLFKLALPGTPAGETPKSFRATGLTFGVNDLSTTSLKKTIDFGATGGGVGPATKA